MKYNEAAEACESFTYGEVEDYALNITGGSGVDEPAPNEGGGPAPGGKAMETTPKIGLDAFCQKLLVYEDLNGIVWIAFNDIVAFSELYYGLSTKPQNMINQRLTATFSKAVKK